MTAHQAFLTAGKFEPDGPTPLMRQTPAGEPYPLDALGPLRDPAAAIHDVTQAPPAIAAQSVLGVAALAAQALGDAETLHGRAPASLYLLTVAQSGERKSACDRLAMAGVRAYETELAEEYRTVSPAHRNQLDVWEERRKAILKGAKADPAGTRADLDALGPQPEGPLLPSVISGEPTLEGMVKHMPSLRPALGIFSDEGGAFIGGHGMNSENRLKTVAGLSGLWDGSAVTRWRAGDGVSTFLGRRLACHLMTQPVAAAGLLADPIANGQGFLARFLMTEPPSAIGTRLRLGHSPGSEATLDRFGRHMGDMLRHPLPLREGARNELDPPLVTLSADARDLLQVFALEVEAAQNTGRSLEAVRPFASKAAEQAARLAAVLTLVADPEGRVVSGETMADAVTLASFYLGEAHRLAGAATISAETMEAEQLRRWLHGSWSDPFVSAADVVHSGPNALRETAKARRALAFLEKYEWVVPVEGGAEVRGKRRREAWRIIRGHDA